jgi:hypothetical protein
VVSVTSVFSRRLLLFLWATEKRENERRRVRESRRVTQRAFRRWREEDTCRGVCGALLSRRCYSSARVKAEGGGRSEKIK